ncbi:MAG: DUF2914 domain-containing protein [Myxococcota bacterium]
MARSAEDDRDVLALPLQRPRRHVSGASTPSRVHPPSFDPEAARKAWRQVARVRGGGPGLGGTPGPRRPSAPALLGVLVGIAVVWGLWSWSDEPADVLPPPVTEAAAVELPTVETQAAPAKAEGPAQLALAEPRPAMPASSIGAFKPTVARMAPPATEDASQRVAAASPKRGDGRAWRGSIPMAQPEPTRPAPPTTTDIPTGPAPATDTAALPLVQRGRAVPPGTVPPGVSAFRKIPKGSRDRAPLEGIGVSGIHVDRLDLGSGYDRGVCQGSNRSYAVAAVKTVHVCFRAVHRRQTERVLVKWSKNGRLVRRVWIVIPAAHAYRSRAGLRLRDASVGAWTVSVESEDGTVLASGDFKVTR